MNRPDDLAGRIIDPLDVIEAGGLIAQVADVVGRHGLAVGKLA